MRLLDSAEQRPLAPAIASRVLGALFAAGALSGALTLLLGGAGGLAGPGLWLNVALPLLTAALLVALAGRIGEGGLLIATLGGVALISRAIVEIGSAGSAPGLLYVWAALYGFLCLGRRGGIVILAAIATGYAVALSRFSGGNDAMLFAMTLATSALAGGLVEFLTATIRRRAIDAASRARSLEIVSGVAHDLARQSIAEEAALVVCRATRALSRASAVALYEPASSGRGLIRIATTEPASAPAELAFVRPDSPAISCFTTGQTIFRERAVLAPGEAPGADLHEPILLDGVAAGVIAIAWSSPVAEPDEEAKRLFSLLAIEAATALERVRTLARLERVARTDELTGLANRRSWDELVATELSRARRERTRLAVAMLDLDHFKRFNDRHGHQAGDRLLKEAAAEWSRVLRPTDVLARYGGEEFALALPGVSDAEADEILSRMRELTPRDQRLSAGLVFWDGSEDEATLIARADEALYHAKGLGRDRVVRS